MAASSRGNLVFFASDSQSGAGDMRGVAEAEVRATQRVCEPSLAIVGAHMGAYWQASQPG